MIWVITICTLWTAAVQASPHYTTSHIRFSNHFGRPGENATYDYVIVGGGTAGITVATRLAEDESLSVAIVEAGDFYEKDHGNISVVPAYCFHYDVDTAREAQHYAPLVDWGYLTTPQLTGKGDTVYHVARGKALGGSSARNAMLYHRGTTGTYHQWATAVGDDSYELSSFLPYFRKSVHYTPPDLTLRAANATIPNPDPIAFSLSGGPLQVSHAKYAMPISSWAKNAFLESGLSELDDMNSGDLHGFAYSTMTIDPADATRSSSESSFLQAAFKYGRSNLKVYTQTLAKQILFDNNKTATSVRVKSARSEYYLNAKKEIILSGGAYNSPQLLMVSGIGPEEILVKNKIKVLANRPGVGQNLWEHLLFPISYEVDMPTHYRLSNPEFAAQVEQEYIINGTGFLSNTGMDMIAFEKLPEEFRKGLSESTLRNLTSFASDWPEVEYMVGNLVRGAGEPGKDYITLFAGLVAPLSRGSVTINSSDTAIQPVIDPAWFTNPSDVEIAVQAFKRLRQIASTQAFKRVVIGEEQLAISAVTDEQIQAYVLANSTTIYHPACTCKMGTIDDPLAVIDSRARVIGVNGLRVVDASSFAVLPPGHPQSTVYALAEKIAKDILSPWP